MDSSLLHKVRVTDIIVETAIAKTFVLQPLNNWQPIYKPGQFITLLFYNTNAEKRRSFSLVSNPAEEQLLKITIKRVPNGEYSRYMLDRILIGDEFYTTGIAGFFTLPEPEDDNIKQLFFLAAGSGITPVFSLISHALKNWQHVSVVLIYSNRNEEDIIFNEPIKSLQGKYNRRFAVEWLFSNNTNVLKARLSNYLLNMLLRKYHAGAHALFYMCGPFDYMLMIQITLLSYGVPARNIYKEQFSTLPRILKPVPPDTDEHKASIHIAGRIFELPVQYPSTILAAAKAKDILLPYSCEAGRCGSCAALCVSGKVWMAYNEVLTDDEVAKGRVLVCQSYPVAGDVVIEF